MQSLGKSFQRSKKASQRSQREKYRGLLEAERNAAILQEEERQQQQRQKGAPLKSIWETSNLEEFLLIADAREKGYEAERDIRVVVDGTPHVVTNDKVLPMSKESVDWLKLSELLTIPRRPKWEYGMSAEAVQAMETSAFFDWRRLLAKMEEEHKVVMTPYEKNLEVWRQLWRVVERADVVLMILDARNPLVFRCADFEAYVRSMCNAAGKSKEIIFLLNKSDLLTESQRSEWATYFAERGEPFIFFPPLLPQRQARKRPERRMGAGRQLRRESRTRKRTMATRKKTSFWMLTATKWMKVVFPNFCGTEGRNVGTTKSRCGPRWRWRTLMNSSSSDGQRRRAAAKKSNKRRE
ncbi:putative GTP-binding protein [Trypanosoma cruzi]|nr:putative GTP-binding protein [Trypanosoma cruzi]